MYRAKGTGLLGFRWTNLPYSGSLTHQCAPCGQVPKLICKLQEHIVSNFRASYWSHCDFVNLGIAEPVCRPRVALHFSEKPALTGIEPTHAVGMVVDPPPGLTVGRHVPPLPHQSTNVKTRRQLDPSLSGPAPLHSLHARVAGWTCFSFAVSHARHPPPPSRDIITFRARPHVPQLLAKPASTRSAHGSCLTKRWNTASHLMVLRSCEISITPVDCRKITSLGYCTFGHIAALLCPVYSTVHVGRAHLQSSHAASTTARTVPTTNIFSVLQHFPGGGCAFQNALVLDQMRRRRQTLRLEHFAASHRETPQTLDSVTKSLPTGALYRIL